MIKAPFNFVPLAANVFYPDWAHLVSHDIPFKDSLSGTIHVTICAETPVFIRNGHVQGIEDNEFSYYLENGKRRYFIPGSSVKGCIRNVLEIMSFGKMQPITNSHTDKNYKHSPQDLEKMRQEDSASIQEQDADSIDLAECIFGRVSKDDSLCGRVQFSHFKCTNVVQMPDASKSFTIVLGTPNPAVLPLYVSQDGERYIDYDEKNKYPDEILNGWKRYILRSGYWTKKPGKDNVTTTFKPLNKGTVFKGDIHYHNLKKEELGALLCALTWHNESDCFHQIGLAKPFGFGRVHVSIDDDSTKKTSEYIPYFEQLMTPWIRKMFQDDNYTWRRNWVIKELFTLAKTIRRWDDKKFYYMEGKESKTAKKNHEYLYRLSKLLKEENNQD